MKQKKDYRNCTTQIYLKSEWHLNSKKLIFLLLISLVLICGAYAQQAKSEYDYPAGDFWALNIGTGMSGTLVEGTAYKVIVDPRLWLSPRLMVGSKVGFNYSVEKNSVESNLGNIFTIEGQVYARWNFLRLGKNPEMKTILFLQGGLGLLSAYRGIKNPFDEVTQTRGSALAEAALGVAIPLKPKWHLEAQGFGGYPHLYGFSLTAGYKFPLPQKIYTRTESQYIEVIKSMPPEEIVKRVKIFAVEFILFGPDIGRYNIGIDRDAQQLNELVLNYVTETLAAHPHYRVRIEGHANPYTVNFSEIEELQILSSMRADVVAEQLRAKGVAEDQIVMIAFGGTRTATSEWDVRNRNRRVELIMIDVDVE